MVESANVLVHIGYHKTASTWLQNNLFSRPDAGFVPFKERDPKYLSYPFFNDKGPVLLSPFCSNASMVQEYIKKTEIPEGRVGVISNERLSGNPHVGGFDASLIANRIKEALPNAKILVFIREQRSMILSLYFQYLGAGGKQSLDKYLSQHYDGKHPKFYTSVLKYHYLILYYKKLFGPENVMVIPYEEFCRDDASTIKKIYWFAGVKTPRSLKRGHYENTIPTRLKVAIKKLRLLNGIRKPSSLNDYPALGNVPYASITADQLQCIAARLYPKKAAQKHLERCQQNINEFVGDAYVKSNEKTAKLINTDIKDKFGYM